MADETSPETPQEAPGAPETPVEASTPTETPAEPVEAPAPPVVPDSSTKLRSDEDALVGEFVHVVEGEHKGKMGAFLRVLTHDTKTGWPKEVMVRTRDAANEVLSVLYEHIRPARAYKGGR